MITGFVHLSYPRNRLHLFRPSASTVLQSPIRFQARLQIRLDLLLTAARPPDHEVCDHGRRRPCTKTFLRQATLSAKASFSKAMFSAGLIRHLRCRATSHPQPTGDWQLDLDHMLGLSKEGRMKELEVVRKLGSGSYRSTVQ